MAQTTPAPDQRTESKYQENNPDRNDPAKRFINDVNDAQAV